MVGRQVPALKDLLQAVKLEAVVALRGNADNAEKVSLSNGRRVGGGGGRHEYLFSCPRWPASFDEFGVVIRPSSSRGDWALAEVTGAPDGKRRVITELDLGQSPGPIQARRDESAAWRALAERFADLAQNPGDFNTALAGHVVGHGDPRVRRAPDPERWITGWPGLQLNPRQRDAVRMALASDATFVWGPPGTGKTDTIAFIIEGCFRQGLATLFLAPTHIAVDQALKRVCDRLSTESGFDSGLVQRVGRIVLEALETRYGDQLDPDRVAQRLSMALDTRIAEAAARLAAIEADLAAHDEVARLHSALRGTTAAAEQERSREQEASRKNAAATAAIAELAREVAAVGQPTGIFGKRRTEKLNALELRLSVAREEVRAANRTQAAAARSAAGHDAIAQQQWARLRLLEGRLASTGSREQLFAHRQDIQGAKAAWDRERRAIPDIVRAGCRVMGATVQKAVLSRKLLDRVDVVVIDEAGMVNLPSAWYAAGLAGKRVVIAGDFRQLPAITNASEDRQASVADKEHAQRWSARDAFHAAGLVADTGLVKLDQRLARLSTQYRMREMICGLVNTIAYPDAPLETSHDERSRIPEHSALAAPLVLVDTSSRRISRENAPNSHKSNQVHEAVVHELVRSLQYDGVLPPRKQLEIPAGERPTDLLAVISPYRDQVRNLSSSLKYRFGSDYDGLVDTVHRFQGSQRPIVIIDTVAGAGKTAGGFYSGTGLDSTTCRLLNVAVSRAQNHLVVVADVEFLRKHAPVGSEVRSMLEYLEDNALRLPVDQLVPIRAAADLATLGEEELARPAFFPADEVERAIEWDIVRAKRSIDIYCAFLNPGPVRRWLKHLRPRIDQGLAVTVFTRNHSDDEKNVALVRELAAAGCQVQVRERMHEKVVILDGEVLWHGSLNLLASPGPTDLMMRFTNSEACGQVQRIIDNARMERPVRSWQKRPEAPTAATGPPTGQGDPRPGEVRDGRFYLKVPFEEKEVAKPLLRAYDIRWDKILKLWHVDARHQTAVTPVAHEHDWL